MNPIGILSQPTEKYESMKFGTGKKGEIGKLDNIKQREEKREKVWWKKWQKL